MPERTKLTTRVHPETEQLLRQMAIDFFGNPKKIGYVLDDAVRFYYTSQKRPEEAQAILSVTEQHLIRLINKHMEAAENRIYNRIGNLMGKTSYQVHYGTAMMEEILSRALGREDWKDIKNQLRKLAAQRMKKQLETEGATEAAKELTEEIQEIETLRKQLQEKEEKLQKAREITRELKELNTNQEKQLADQKKQYEDLRRWVNGLISHLNNEGGGMIFRKSPKESLEEYLSQHPKPEGL